MVLNKRLLSLFVVFIPFAILLSQTTEDNIRVITITQGDSLIKAGVCYNTPKTVPETNAPFYWYSAGRIHQNSGSYSGKPLHGKYEVFDKGNNLVEQGSMKYGLKEGTWTTWHPNGARKEISFYKNGLKENETFQYNEKNILIAKRSFHKGVLEGKTYNYEKDTTLIKDFKAGKELQPKNKSKNIATKKKKENSGKPKKVKNTKRIVQNDTILADSTVKKSFFKNLFKSKRKGDSLKTLNTDTVKVTIQGLHLENHKSHSNLLCNLTPGPSPKREEEELHESKFLLILGSKT